MQKGNPRLLLALGASACGILFALAASCGGDSGTPPPVAAFDPDIQPPAPAETVTIQEGAASGTTMDLRVTVTQVPGVHSASFDITFDPAVARFAGFSDTGSFLDCGLPGELQTSAVLDPSDSGRVIVGMARIISSPLCSDSLTSCTSDADCPPGETCGRKECDAGSDDLLLTLTFEIRTRGSTPVSFAPTPAGEDPALEDFAGISRVPPESFFGGTLSGI